ncbi:hypothetical protein OIU78_024590 [Salix suchowensis]|nr:hypothetical protein OIU78_024590 [Salix suchowensis]
MDDEVGRYLPDQFRGGLQSSKVRRKRDSDQKLKTHLLKRGHHSATNNLGDVMKCETESKFQISARNVEHALNSSRTIWKGKTMSILILPTDGLLAFLCQTTLQYHHKGRKVALKIQLHQMFRKVRNHSSDALLSEAIDPLQFSRVTSNFLLFDLEL